MRQRKYNGTKSPLVGKIGTESDLFTTFMENMVGMPCVKEYRFHDVRHWRFDYAFPSLKIAIECDGGVFTNGRHVRPQGYINDMEKFNHAAMLGWLVLKFTPEQMISHETAEQVRATIKTRLAEIAERSNKQK